MNKKKKKKGKEKSMKLATSKIKERAAHISVYTSDIRGKGVLGRFGLRTI